MVSNEEKRDIADELRDEYAPGDPLRMAMREYWKEAEVDGC